MKFSVIMPAFNEEATIEASIARVLAQPFIDELIIVNDGSTDLTRRILDDLQIANVKIAHHEVNQGKGAAIRTGLRHVTGQIGAIQDADLEYDPADLEALIAPIISGVADVVYGSRFAAIGPRRVLYFWHSLGNRVLTLASNAATNLNLTDMETCYKVFRMDAVEELLFEENRFGFEPEFTVKVARAGLRIFEVGISYDGRTYAQGKKIGWKDGFSAVRCITKYSIRESVRRRRNTLIKSPAADQKQLFESLESLSSADNYYDWIQELVEPYLGKHSCELGAGSGTFTKRIAEKVDTLVALEPDKNSFEFLTSEFVNDGERVRTIHAGAEALVDLRDNSLDSVVLVNVLEHLEKHKSVMRELARIVRPGGHIIIWVPASELLYSPFDMSVGHFRRYSKLELKALALDSGLQIVNIQHVNLLGSVAWAGVAKLGRQAPTQSKLTSMWDNHIIPRVQRIEKSVSVPFGQSLLSVTRVPEI